MGDLETTKNLEITQGQEKNQVNTQGQENMKNLGNTQGQEKNLENTQGQEIMKNLVSTQGQEKNLENTQDQVIMRNLAIILDQAITKNLVKALALAIGIFLVHLNLPPRKKLLLLQLLPLLPLPQIPAHAMPYEITSE